MEKRRRLHENLPRLAVDKGASSLFLEFSRYRSMSCEVTRMARLPFRTSFTQMTPGKTKKCRPYHSNSSKLLSERVFTRAGGGAGIRKLDLTSLKKVRQEREKGEKEERDRETERQR
jgi:hypothetical protein